MIILLLMIYHAYKNKLCNEIRLYQYHYINYFNEFTSEKCNFMLKHFHSKFFKKKFNC